MSPTKKKAPGPRKAPAKKQAPKASAAAKPAKTAKAAADKTTTKKSAARSAGTAATGKKAAKAAATPSKDAGKKAEKDKAKVAAKAAPEKAPAKGAKAALVKPAGKTAAKSGKAAAGKKGEDEAAATRRTKPKKPVTPTGPRHPKLGYRWACFSCDAKFYDLGKEEPLCPKCGADQRDRPADEPRAATADPARPRVVRPMAQLLDDDEPVAPMVEDELGLDDVGEAGDMFEGDGDITHIELDAADLEGESIEAAETDEF